MLSRHNLHDYQLRAVDFIKQHNRVALFLFLGAGKTTSTLTAIADMLDGFAAKKVLVIAPLRVANSVWKQEAKLWHHLQHLSIRVCTGSQKNRMMNLQHDADIYVINRENVQWLVDFYGAKWPFDTVVIDESSSFRNSRSKRWKALRKALFKIDNMILLTGTPASNGLENLWAQMYLIDYGKALGRTKSSFLSRFFDTDYFGRSFTPKAGSAEKIYDLIAPHVLSMIEEDYLQLPERIDLYQPIDLPADIQAKYTQFEKSLFLEHNGEEIEAPTAAVLAGKLLQFASGANYTDGTGNWVLIHEEKLNALQDIIEDNPDENLLVAYNFKSDLERILARFPQAVVLDQDPETLARWNRGEISMLLAHPQSASHGLNAQRGGRMIVWFSLNWSLEYYLQFNGRLHRQGQTLPVRIVHLVCNNTIDERVVKVLRQKDIVQSDLLKALR